MVPAETEPEISSEGDVFITSQEENRLWSLVLGQRLTTPDRVAIHLPGQIGSRFDSAPDIVSVWRAEMLTWRPRSRAVSMCVLDTAWEGLQNAFFLDAGLLAAQSRGDSLAT